MENTSLDNFIMENGKEVTENNMQLLDKEQVEKKLNTPIKLAYDNDTPIPGENINNKLDMSLSGINEATALDSLITKSAIIKAEKEKEQIVKTKKLTKAEREKYRKEFIDSLMYQQGENYYQANHYIMDGRTKRRVRKKIENDFDKGRYDKFLIPGHTNLNG